MVPTCSLRGAMLLHEPRHLANGVVAAARQRAVLDRRQRDRRRQRDHHRRAAPVPRQRGQDHERAHDRDRDAAIVV